MMYGGGGEVGSVEEGGGGEARYGSMSTEVGMGYVYMKPVYSR